jgi:hypothetical protein
MAFPSSALAVATFVDALDTTQLALDLDLETHKIALYTNSITGTDLTVDTAYGSAPWNANEVANGSGYTTGGPTLATTVFTHGTGGVVKFDSDDPSWSSATFTSRGGLIYADALAGNNIICAINWGSDVSVTSGTFTVQVAAAGWWTIDFVP